MQTINKQSSEYANSNFQHCTYHYTDDKRLTDYDSIKDAFKAGVEFAQQWITVDEEKPIAYESGNWDGLRSDFILVKDIHGKVYVAKSYQGVIDGSNFCDFCDDNGYIPLVKHWRPISVS